MPVIFDCIYNNVIVPYMGLQPPNVAVIIGFQTYSSDSGWNGSVVVSENPIMTRNGLTQSVDGYTPFELGSISKVFTTGIFQQQQGFIEGQSQPLGGYLDGLPVSPSTAVAEIDVKNIAAYSSGFYQDNGECARNNNDTDYPYNLTSSLVYLFDFLKDYTPPFPQGDQYTYSNLAAALLAMAAFNPKLTSLDTPDFASQYNDYLVKFCNLFGVDTYDNLTTTLFSSYPAVGALPLGYSSDDLWTTLPPDPLPEAGAGGIVSCGADMLQFLKYCMTGNATRDMTPGYPSFMQVQVQDNTDWCSTQSPRPNASTGYGWFLKNVDKHQVVTKNGGVPGFSSWMGFLQKSAPDENSQAGLFVLTNTADADGLAVGVTGVTPGAFPCLLDSLGTASDG